MVFKDVLFGIAIVETLRRHLSLDGVYKLVDDIRA